ncbi:MAG TPA: futalosine hydrolase [Actinocrinis sp.]|uniref:futalosine hydrolase n=1 Tax=Actinocrinis sp. TaxID=1920516 RepID=UPI002D4DC127|nr:futalosine hydrolase [Actinocrinis sp.]HZU57132.1 futalosine hydrolase [Actinocrinis sp.]
MPAPIKPNRTKRCLIVTAVEAERDAFERGLVELPEERRASVTLLVGGVTAAVAAAATAVALAREPFDLVVSAGIGGVFPESGGLGDLLIAERIIAADLGADGPEGFQSVEELGFGTTVIDSLALDGLKAVGGRDAVRGDMLTVSTGTGTAERAAWLRTRYPAAVGEAMEGYGVAVAAAQFALPVAEVRAASNLVGPRDRSAWRIGEALSTLTAAAVPIVEGLLG